MRNASMRRISSGYSLMSKCACFAILIFLSFKEFSSGFDWALLGLWLFMMIFGIFIILRDADSVFESADGTFLRVKISWFSERTLPLSAIESVDAVRDEGSLKIKVKRRSSANSFLPAVFYFIPNENYFRSALFRQFPISQDPEDFDKSW